jgi:glycosyltransferase involved in cell wall biosynthesis
MVAEITVADSDLLFSVDTIKTKGRVLFAYGWAFSKSLGQLEGARLVLLAKRFQELEPLQQIDLDIGLERADVQQAFPAFARGPSRSGWRTLVRVDNQSFDAYQLLFTWSDGSTHLTHAIAMPQEVIENSRTETIARRVHLMIQASLKFFALVRNGKLQYAVGKARERLRERPKKNLVDETDYAALFNHPTTTEDWVFVVDHDMGGGANKFRTDYVAKHIELGASVIVLKSNVAQLSEVVEIWRGERCEEYRVRTIDGLMHALHQLKIRLIVYNNLVSYAEPLAIVRHLIDLKYLTGAKIDLFVHDYFMICPSPHLVNAVGSYCNLPTPDVCTKCLSENKRSFVRMYRGVDIDEWRGTWNNLIKSSDRIVAFSRSSKSILSKVYDEVVVDKRISIKPHPVNVFRHHYQKPDKDDVLTLGVVGHINFEKGSDVVCRLAKHIQEKQLPMRVVVIGTLNVDATVNDILVTGKYQANELPKLLEMHSIDCCFIPSICPETFSYVAQELIELGAPVACFPIGAPPERIIGYNKGKVLVAQPNSPAQVIYDELIQFHESLDLNE